MCYTQASYPALKLNVDTLCCVPYAQIELQLHSIHDQTNYLTTADLEALLHDTGVRPWSFIQRLGDAVFIPGGCPHQVRNLRSCLKAGRLLRTST